jgi:uncharacterized protein YhbP (UPF0306 family)
MDRTELTKELITNNRYLSLSTSDGKNVWIAPLYYVADDKWNLYFVSPIESLHAKHIIKNPNVAFCIFDSTQEPGTGIGLQANAVASMIDSKDYPEVVVKYIKSLEPFNISMEKYRVFKLLSTKMFVTDQEAWEKEGVDKRVEVKF